jgi:hypothetical protein
MSSRTCAEDESRFLRALEEASERRLGCQEGSTRLSHSSRGNAYCVPKSLSRVLEQPGNTVECSDTHAELSAMARQLTP